MKSENFMKTIKGFQADELLEYYVYVKIARFVKDKNDRDTLLKIAGEEQKHYEIWKQYTKCDVKPNMFIVYWYVILARILGYTFIIKKMENSLTEFKGMFGEKLERELAVQIPDIKILLQDEMEHESELIDMIDEEKLKYAGSMVLGLNDALVEFTGSLAGWTFAMQSNRLISLAGLITGIAATLSMASSEYLSVKHEEGKNPIKSSLYTGAAYLLTVVILILPYLLLPDNRFVTALLIMLAAVIIIIAAFNYYISVAKSISFKKKFLEMSLISLSVAAASFVIGLLVKKFLGIEV
ncbi:VIT1/CCC1 transporter family protein [Anaerocolumna xylanovorans]|uniref:Predicted Fe2+/Mn2+ transporter, VIT1/CCC1 family n=1 Tax=Anaerocolumna xylanovorans DSM 12503 TaxID=1121345 RepID=A0A1M7XZB1_9FIRM|nr:VIT1/CCC1 transporter family protein [Anaerocolumna xylanovorans]SHO44392.1 Predicted Fe2+/Mn2+ transporter, VIT1/CCC1 family [Anaerocolumna xylanovorans DSM 12503]